MRIFSRSANNLNAGLDQPLLDLINAHHPAAKRSLASPASLDLMRIFRNPMRLSQPVYDSWRNSARLYYTLPHEPQELQ